MVCRRPHRHSHPGQGMALAEGIDTDQSDRVERGRALIEAHYVGGDDREQERGGCNVLQSSPFQRSFRRHRNSLHSAFQRADRHLARSPPVCDGGVCMHRSGACAIGARSRGFLPRNRPARKRCGTAKGVMLLPAYTVGPKSGHSGRGLPIRLGPWRPRSRRQCGAVEAQGADARNVKGIVDRPADEEL